MAYLNCKTTKRIEEYIFYALILSIPFTDFSIKIPFVGYYLPHLFILLGIVTISFEYLQHGFRLSKLEKHFLVFGGIAFIWYFICDIYGFISYPFGPLSHWADLKEVLVLQNHFGNIFSSDQNLIYKIAVPLYFIRMSFFDCLYTFGASFFVIHIYHNHSGKGFKVLKKGIIILVSLIILDSLIELPALMGNDTFQFLLSIINRHIMAINHVGGYWPPMFWMLQVRSIFAEPSFFGLGVAVIFPVLLYWSIYYSRKSQIFDISFAIVLIYSLLAFCTRSRTTVLLVIAETCLFFISLYLTKVLTCRNFSKIIFSILLAFLISLPLASTFVGTWYGETNKKNSITSMASTYVEDNITSVVNKSNGGQKRSNSIRTALNIAYLRVGMEHPVFGVGITMTPYYIDSNLTEADLELGEIAGYHKDLLEKGDRKAGFPILNYFAYQFATYGLIGLMLYLLPILYILYNAFKKVKMVTLEEDTLLIALVGSLASCFSNAPLVSMYIVIGLLICFVYSRNIEECV